MHKLGVIVPYRNRKEHLEVFVPYLCKYLQEHSIDYEIIVVEQEDDRPFNRGSLLNVGFLKAEDLGCDYVAFHDVDMLPSEADYSYSDVPVELVGCLLKETDLESSKIKEIPVSTYFGGVTIFPTKVFVKINGYSNKYRGWGFEDDDLLRRCLERGISVDEDDVRKASYFGPALFFDGNTSYLKGRLPFVKNVVEGKVIDSQGYSFVVTFQNLGDSGTESCIFSIPGMDFRLSVESYGTLKLEWFDIEGNCHSIRTKNHIDQDLHQAAVTVNNTLAKLYVDGVCVDSQKIETPVRFYSGQLYVGARNTNCDLAFRGRIINLLVTTGVLPAKSVRDLYSRGITTGYTGPVGEYNPRLYRPQVYFESRFLEDCSKSSCKTFNLAEVGKALTGVVSRVDLIQSLGFFEKIAIPYKRNGKFFELEHKKEGYSSGIPVLGPDSRKNRERYRAVCRSETYQSEDGLSTVYDCYKITSQKIVNVGDFRYFLVTVTGKSDEIRSLCSV